MKKNHIEETEDLFRIDRSIVEGRGLSVFYQWFWIWFGGRKMGRNGPFFSFNDEKAGGYFFIMMFIGFSIFVHHFIGFLFVLTYLVLPSVLGIMTFTISAARKFVWGCFLNIGLGFLAIHYHFNLHLEIFGWHPDKYIYEGMIIAGIIGLYHRAWNAVIWYVHDKAVVSYFKKHNISMSVEDEKFESYIDPFFKLRTQVSRLLDQRFGAPVFTKHCHGQTQGHVDALIAFIREEANRDTYDQIVRTSYKLPQVSAEKIQNFEDSYKNLGEAVSELMAKRFKKEVVSGLLSTMSIKNFNKSIDLIEEECWHGK